MDRRDSLKVLGGAGVAALGGYGAYTVLLRDGAGQTPGREEFDPAPSSPEVDRRDGRLLLGVSPSERDLSVLAPFERWLGKRHAVVGSFVNMGADESEIEYAVTGLLETTWRRGHVPHVFWQPYLPSREDVSQEINREIADGEHDETLQTWADTLASWAVRDDEPDRRVYLNLAPEMNGDWAPWSPALGEDTEEDFVAMWRRVHDVVHGTALESDHVQWIWTLDTTNRGVDQQAIYPGDEYVDWASIHGYNWTTWGAWLWPEEVYAERVETVRSITDKPLAITELGCSAETMDGGYAPDKKGRWIERAYQFFEEHDVRMTLWFNVVKEADWRVFDADPAASTATVRGQDYGVYPEYRRAVKEPDVLPPDRSNDRRLADDEFAGQF